MNIQKKLHRNSLASLLIVLQILTVTGCGSVATEVIAAPSATAAQYTSSPNKPPTSTPSPTGTPIPTETPTPFVPKATIKVASHSPLSVQFADFGTDVMRGAGLAVKQLSDPLMELGYKMELVSYDDQNNFGVAVTIAKQIVADPEILCVVGPFTSRILNQVKEVYHQAGLAFISPSATAAFATESGYPEVNRLLGRNDGEGAAGAQFANAQGFASVFIVSQNTDPAKFISKYFKNEANRLGMSVVGDMPTDEMKDFDRIVERVISSKADLVYFSTLNPEQAGNFFREIRAAGYIGALMGPSSLDTSSLAEFAGPLLMEGGGMYFTTPVMSASNYPGAAKFLDDFLTMHGSTPQIFAAQAYDAAGICLRAIEEASKAKGGEIPSRAEVAKTIRDLQDYHGITGAYNFDLNGDPNPARYFVLQVASVDPNDWDKNIMVTSFEVTPPK